ncbi:MAG: PQQ-binding-like beta-propeller repeat protein [Pirellulales bacterium]
MAGNHGSVFVDANNHIFATRNNRVLAFDSAGNVLWQFTADDQVLSSVILDDQGVLYFGTTESLYAIAHIVPEPAGYISMLAGVATTGFLFLRRRYRLRRVGGTSA